MPITVYEQAADFLTAAEDHLLQNEIANAGMVGVCRRMVSGEGHSMGAPFFATITDDKGLLTGAAAMNPPFNVILALGTPPDALLDLIAVLRGNNWPVPGVIGPQAEAEAFAAAWTSITGQMQTFRMDQRIYELRNLIPPIRPASGLMRPATLDDLDLLAPWMDAFQRAIIPQKAPGDNRPILEQRITAGYIFVWQDGGAVVSMAAKARPAGHGITINLVYTPPEHRRKGYASSCVAALSQHCLDLGYDYCTLSTDLSNPTANTIYSQLGYRPVCDFAMIHFGE